MTKLPHLDTPAQLKVLAKLGGLKIDPQSASFVPQFLRDEAMYR